MEANHPKIFRDEQGSLFLNFGDYGKEVEVAAISGDGRRILMVKEVGVARVWNVESNEAVATIIPKSPLAGKTGPFPGREFKVFIESAALNSDGRWALLGLNDGTAVVFEVEEPDHARSILHPPNELPSEMWGVIRSVSYSEDDLAVVGFPGRCAGIWSTDGLQRVAFLDAGSTRLVGTPFVRDTLTSSVSVSRDGRYVFVGAVDMTALIFDLQTGDVVFEAMMHAEDIVALSDGPSGVGWATTGGNVWLQSPDGILQHCLQTNEHWEEVEFDPKGDRLITRSFDGSVAIWTLDGRRTALQEASPGWIPSAKSTLCLTSELALYLADAFTIAVNLAGRDTSIKSDHRVVRALMTPTGDAIGIDGWADEVSLWDPLTGELIRKIPAAGGSGCFAFSPDSRLIAIGEIGHGGGRYPRRVYVYELESGDLLHRLSEHDWQIRQVAFSPDGRFLASLGDDVVVWDLRDLTKPVLRHKNGRATGGILFAGEDLIAVGEGQVVVFANCRKARSFEAPIGFQSRWTMSQDQQFLCISGNQSVCRFRVATGELVQQITANIPRPDRFPPQSVGATHKCFAGGALWKTAYGTFLHQSDGPRGWVQPLALTRQGVVVPGESCAVVFAGDAKTVLGTVTFAGRLRAARVVNGQSLIVNHLGHLYRSSVKAV